MKTDTCDQGLSILLCNNPINNQAAIYWSAVIHFLHVRIFCFSTRECINLYKRFCSKMLNNFVSKRRVFFVLQDFIQSRDYKQESTKASNFLCSPARGSFVALNFGIVLTKTEEWISELELNKCTIVGELVLDF